MVALLATPVKKIIVPEENDKFNKQRHSLLFAKSITKDRGSQLCPVVMGQERG